MPTTKFQRNLCDSLGKGFGDIMQCPKCRSERFTVSAIEYHTWVVDENGDFIEDIGCLDSTSNLSEAECFNCGEVVCSNNLYMFKNIYSD
jgi:hypothetical protein